MCEFNLLQEIADGIFYIEGQLKARYPFSNSILIKGESENILIDTGIGSKLRKLRKQFTIDKILLSHAYEDHISGNKFFKKSKIGIHKLDKEGVESIKYLQKIYGLEDPSFDELFYSFMLSIGYKERKVDFTFQDKEIFDLGDIKIEIIHTPGHSAGHCCFYIHPYHIMFLSDIDLTSFGPWYGSVDGNISDFIQSIKKVMNYKIDIAISSHKGVFQNNINNKLRDFLKKFEDRDTLILENLKEKKSLNDLIKKALIYGKIPDPKEMFLIAEELMVKKHLYRLLENKIIKEKNGMYFV